MKVLAAGKSTRPAPASAPHCGCCGNLGHSAIASGTPTRRRHTDTWGTRAAGPGRRRRWVAAGSERRHMVPAPRAQPVRGPAGWRAREGAAAAFLLLLLLAPATLPSALPALLSPDSPSLFLSFCLSAFSFPTASRAAPREGHRPPSSLQTPAGTEAGAASIC